MSRCVVLFAMAVSGLGVSAVAQTQAPSLRPFINPDGIVRADTTRPGMLTPGIVFSIWGHGYGPHDGCKGPAVEVCGVRVLLDGAPIEVQYTNDLLINARMPEAAPPQAVSQLVVVSGGVRSDPVDVRRAPEVAVISLDGVARVDGPIWIHVELPRSLGVSYPAMGTPWNFACNSFEVRKDGKAFAPMLHPQLGGGYSGGSCPGTVNLKAGSAQSRLPLHLQYDFREPGTYEVRLSHYGNFTRRPDDLRIQSAWTPIVVEAAAAGKRVIGARPQEPTEVISEFLPGLLALRDDDLLGVLVEYLYHASPRVRSYAANALYYWPDSAIEARLLASLRANGPSPVVVRRLSSHATEVAEASLPYFFSDDPVLFQGAVAGAGVALEPAGGIDPQLRSRVEERLMAAATGNTGHGDAQTTNDLISLLGRVHNDRVHDLLWNLVEHHTGTEQALIVIAWQKNAKDLPRLADYLIATPADDQAAQMVASVPYAMRNTFGQESVPWLREVLEKGQSVVLRLRCAEELMRANDSAGFAFALDAVEHNRAWKRQVRDLMTTQFPETRDESDVEAVKFLSARAK